MGQAQFFPRAHQKPFTWKREDGELCPSDKMGSKAERAGEPACSEHRARKGEGPIRAPKTTSLQGLGWEGRSCEGRGERTGRCVTETKGSSRQREQVAVLTAAERLRRMTAPQPSPGGSLWQDLSNGLFKPHTGTLLTSSVMGARRIIYSESRRKIYGFMGLKKSQYPDCFFNAEWKRKQFLKINTGKGGGL